MRTLAVIGVPGACPGPDGVRMTRSFGLVITELARQWDQVQLAVPLVPENDPQLDFTLPDNVILHALPPMVSSLRGVWQTAAMARGYEKAIAQADAVFARGVMIPAVPQLYRACRRRGLPLVHWMVGNPLALLESHSRYGWWIDGAGKVFVRSWERQLRKASRQGKTALLCNGQEIAERYPDARTVVTVSTTLTKEDLHSERTDTCDQALVRILMVAHIRPEKGIEYLLQALPMLQSDRSWHLTLAGSRKRYRKYQEKLDKLVVQQGLSDRITWTGHEGHQALTRHFAAADVFVLPTLSEGTPRVLLEAQAHGVPLVATRAGGIPTAIDDGVNGLLVPAKDPRALARALDRILDQPTLRHDLIAGGHRFAREHTVDRFARQVTELLAELAKG